MSLETWKQEFYIPVEECPKGHEARASRQKWEGLKEENLIKHQIYKFKNDSDLLDAEENRFIIDWDSCHLCVAFNDCEDCDGFKANSMTCEPFYRQWERDEGLSGMLTWLDKAVEYETKLEKENT